MALHDVWHASCKGAREVLLGLIDHGFCESAYARMAVAQPAGSLINVEPRTMQDAIGGHAAMCGRLVRLYCPEVPIVSIDVVGAGSYAPAQSIAQAIRWAADEGLRVALVALATTARIDADVIDHACRYAAKRNCIVVSPADNLTGQGYPATCKTVIGVVAAEVWDAHSVAWLGEHGVEVVAEGSPLNGAIPQGTIRVPSSSWAAARCAGVVASLLTHMPSATRDDVLNHIKLGSARRPYKCIYIGGTRMDAGTFRRYLALRSKLLLAERHTPFELGHALIVGKRRPCIGMPIKCRSLEDATDSDRFVGQVRHDAWNAWHHIDTVILTSDCDRQTVATWVKRAVQYRKNIILTHGHIADTLRHKLAAATNSGCRVWVSEPTVLPAPRWYLRGLRSQLPMPCITLLSDGADGKTVGRCKTQIDRCAEQFGHRVLWVSDMPDGWLAGCNLSAPLESMARRSVLSLDTVVGVLEHEIRRRAEERGACIVGAIVTQPLLLSRPSGHMALSPWAGAFLAVLNPGLVIAVRGTGRPEWVHHANMHILVGALGTSQVRIVCEHSNDSKDVAVSQQARWKVREEVATLATEDDEAWRRIYVTGALGEEPPHTGNG